MRKKYSWEEERNIERVDRITIVEQCVSVVKVERKIVVDSLARAAI